MPSQLNNNKSKISIKNLSDMICGCTSPLRQGSQGMVCGWHSFCGCSDDTVVQYHDEWELMCGTHGSDPTWNAGVRSSLWRTVAVLASAADVEILQHLATPALTCTPPGNQHKRCSTIYLGPALTYSDTQCSCITSMITIPSHSTLPSQE